MIIEGIPRKARPQLAQPVSIAVAVMDEADIRRMVEEGISHSEISYRLRRRHPGVRGLSERSVRRFCFEHDIHSNSGVSNRELRQIVEAGVREVGPAYGRKMMKGYLQTRGFCVWEKRVGWALGQVAPGYHRRRQALTHGRVNPIPYYAQYCGHKMHIDQNEKLVMYGVTHVLAIDGYSGFILGIITMPIKNNILIYSHLFRPILIQFGLWDQIRVDHGKEFILSLYVQERLANLRRNQRRAPHVQSMSRENHPAERIWVEVNQRVNYPVKECLNDLVETDQLDLNDDIVKFCISWLAMRVCQAGIELFVLAWNNHPIPGKELLITEFKITRLLDFQQEQFQV
ncbi:uncharacterized protein LOC134198068 isoform X2 [Corticium candelabrum]|uniref:uncharacterized protein LOC134198068 isoform X2 n=1 Tax=Corticium candelabrum TaxID=121492 RepID=UPI002E25243E|nr:uncharacterized protein LOC134198068 isoform X2 [Corticium candelabrum]